MGFWEAIWKSSVLGVVQGLTEFLPVSSSGHLTLLQRVLGFDMGDGTIDNITLQECVRKGEIVFEYVYDIFNRRSMLITFTGESEEMPKESYPRLVSERGIRPDQFSSEHDTDEEFHATVKPSVADEPEDDYSDIPEENEEDDED